MSDHLWKKSRFQKIGFKYCRPVEIWLLECGTLFSPLVADFKLVYWVFELTPFRI